MRYGVFLARMQPLHNGHLALIRRAVVENDKVLILIGSSDKLNKRNPIPGSFRKQLLEVALTYEFTPEQCEKIKVVLLPDLTSEEDNSHDWGFYLYSNIVKHIGQHDFTMYYSDGWEIITRWFPGFILQNSVNLSLVGRNNSEEGISATKVRDMILHDYPDINKYVPKEVVDNLNIIKAFIQVWE